MASQCRWLGANIAVEPIEPVSCPLIELNSLDRFASAEWRYDRSMSMRAAETARWRKTGSRYRAVRLHKFRGHNTQLRQRISGFPAQGREDVGGGTLRWARRWRLVDIVKGCGMDGGFMLGMIGPGLFGLSQNPTSACSSQPCEIWVRHHENQTPDAPRAPQGICVRLCPASLNHGNARPACATVRTIGPYRGGQRVMHVERAEIVTGSPR